MQKKTRTKHADKREQGLSPALQQSFAHFLQCHSPKFFSRNLRNMLVEVMTCQQGNHPLYLNSLLLAMEMFFDVLDTAEDEGVHNKGKP